MKPDWHNSSVALTDHDLVIDKRDACPNDSGDVFAKGCPDTDEDGILNKDDRCVDKPGPKENDGCPLAKLHLLDKQGNIVASATVDKDGKFTFTTLPVDESALLKLESFDVLIANEVTVVTGRLVRVARRGADGFFHFENLATDKGKMGQMDIADVQIKLKKEEAEKVKHAMETLEFDFGSDVIRASSTDALDLVAELLQQNHTWRLKLSGHTDNVSTLKYNMNLSKKRVESIKKYLIKKGVAADNVVLKWYGPTKPIAPNDTEEGRQKNRRVEFLIIQ
jgi:outer membrane protein OmpA-like peptidoglycan-associated protein